jgi:hypothetical protein
MFTVNVAPDMGMYHLLRSQGYDPAYAVAEFIDNALQAHEDHQAGTRERKPLTVEVRFYSNDFPKSSLRNSLSVQDDGPGIKKARLADAMKPAKPPPMKGLSEFGIGMKAAAVWFSDVWELETKPTGSGSQYSLVFNLTELVSAGTDSVQVLEARSASQSRTTITLKQLRRPIDQNRFDQICEDLTELYQRYTASSSPRMVLTAHYNDTPVSLKYEVASRPVLVAPVHKLVDSKAYAIGKDRRWQVPIKMTFQGAAIEGFICLLERGSYVDNPGLVMFRGDRVIRGTMRRPNLPQALFRTGNKYSRQRVYGQLFADGLPVTYTKDGFEIDEDAFATQLRAVEGMDELLRQAEEYRANKPVVAVAKLTDIPGIKTATVKAATKNSGKSTAAPAPSPAPSAAKKTTAPPPAPKPALLALLEDLKDKTASLALRSMIEETIFQHQFRREIGTALCLRTVLEVATLDHIKRKLPSVYPNVEEKAIKSLVNYMNSNRGLFFTAGDKPVVKCVENAALGSQPDVILLNNVAHGSYQPNFPELNRFATNLEPLMRWAIN